MNYIAEIKAFYDRLELNPLPSPAIVLWHALMSIANKTGWQQEFTVAVSVLVLKSGLNAQAIKRARNRLEQDGFITWRSRGGNQSAIYHLNSIVVQNDARNVPQCEPQSEPQTDPQSVPQCEPQSEPINKHKLNKTNIPPISPVERFEDFLSAYPKECNRYLTETAYIDLLMTGKLTEEVLIECAHNYAETCRILKTQEKYVKNAENFLKELVFEKYLPGKYKKPKGETKQQGQFNQFPQRNYDFEALENELLKEQI
ncbi:MAG: hypothetical protein HDR20_12360 [Lachnospiraceae bacterium]|nr:hypothetical protein [Lachnospiraceae bacterium]